MRHNIVRLFELRKGHLDSRIRRDYIRNGIAAIPCRISGYDDVISSYSEKGYETLNPEFVDYLKGAAEVVPDECPLVLNIIGEGLTKKEKITIEEVIRDDAAYDLGMVEKEEKRHTRIFYLMFFGMLLSGVILWFTRSLSDEPREVLWILFWFMGEMLCDFLFFTGSDLRRERRRAGRLASIKVVFFDTYEDPDYTDTDVEQLYSEIEKDVMETIREEDHGDRIKQGKNRTASA